MLRTVTQLRNAAIAVVVALAATAGATTPAFADDPNLPASISGVVTAADSAAALPGIHVELVASDGSPAGGATTDADGAYALTGLAAGSYFLRSWVDAGSAYLSAWWEHGSSAEDADAIVVAAGEDAIVSPELALGGSVSGTVRSGAVGVAGATVDLLDGSGAAIRTTTSGEEGGYEFVGLPTDNYDLRATPPAGSTLLVGHLNAIAVSAGALTADANIDLAEAPKLDLTSTPAPVISGTTTVGELLSAAPGTWEPAPVLLTYQWLRDGTPISLATSDTYRLDPADAGTAISVSVSGEKTGYSPVTRTSTPTPQVATAPLSGPTPVISGAALVGQTLTAGPGTWGPAPVTLSYQWKRNGAVIDLATGSTYLLVPLDAGKSITVSVTGTKDGFTTLTTTSSAAVPANVLAATPVPTVTGTPRVASVLTAVPGSWGPAPVALTYQWKRGGFAIPGATGTAYIPTAADAGTQLTVTVTGTKPGYATVQKTSAATALVTGGVISAAPVPTIAGTAKVGSVLTAATGSWGPAPVTLSYQWKRGGVAISGATARTYTAANADVGSTLTVTVTGTRPGYTAVARTSAATAGITGGILTGPVPIVSGAPKVGSVLTAVPGGWSPAPVSLAYQWKRAGVPIAGATAAKYTVTTADAGAALTVSVTGTRTGFTTLLRTSAPTPMVTGAGLTATPVPAVTGTQAVGAVLTATAGTWAPAPVSLAYQWKRAGVAIAGATGSTYRLTAADVGFAVTVSVTGARAGYTSVTKTSAGVTLPRQFAVAPVPTISGSAQVGALLTAVPGAWSPTTAFTFQWTRNGAVIAGATLATYRLVAADAGLPVRVIVTAVKTGYATTSRTSAPVTAPRVFTSAPAPVITGTTTTRAVLTAATGTWAPAAPAFSYQWMRGGTPIVGATSSTYTVQPGDLDSMITVRVTAARAGFTSVTLTSAARPALGIAYPNCTALNADYPAGVAKAGTTFDLVSGVQKSMPTGVRYSTSLYNLNTGRDGDGDGIACEKR